MYSQGDHRNQKAIFQPFGQKQVFFQLFLAKKYIFFQPLVTKNIIYSSLIYKFIINFSGRSGELIRVCDERNLLKAH